MDDCCRLVLPYHAVKHATGETDPCDSPRTGAKSTTTSSHTSTFTESLEFYCLEFQFLDTSGHPTSAPQYITIANIQHMHITIRNLGKVSGLCFFFQVYDSHPYSHETSIFTLGAPNEEVQGRQTKLRPGFTMGKLVQLSSGISILRDSHIVLSKQS